jgi:predicted DNA-binding transcriptional regulator YafY
MAEPKFKPQYRRLLFIDGEIRKGKYPNCTGLAREWEVSPRTVQRDIDYLRWELGAPMEYDAIRHGFLYTDRSWFLPSVVLSEGDLLGLLIGTQAAAMYHGTPIAEELQAIYGKLAGFLPAKVSLPPELICERVSFSGPPSRPVDAVVWRTVLRGLMSQQELEVEYRSSGDDVARLRVLRPYHLLNLDGEWYVVAADPAADGVRQFAVSRIGGAKLTDRAFEIPADFDVRPLLAGRFGKILRPDAGKPTKVRLRFDASMRNYALEKQWHPEQKAKVQKGGAVVLEMPVTATSDLVPWILGFGHRVQVEAPKALRDEVRAELQAAVRQYRVRS